LSRSGICDDEDAQGEGSNYMLDGKWNCMGRAMNKDSVEVKDDIVRGTESSEDPVANGRCNLNDKVGRTSQEQQRKVEVAGEGVPKPVHTDEQIEMCNTDCGQSVQQPVRSTATPLRRASARGRRVSHIVVRMKRQPRTQKASALRVPPYINHLHGRKRTKGRQNKSVTIHGRNVSKDTDEAAGGDSQHQLDDHTQHAPDDQIEQAEGCVQPIDVIQGDCSERISNEVRFLVPMT